MTVFWTISVLLKGRADLIFMNPVIPGAQKRCGPEGVPNTKKNYALGHHMRVMASNVGDRMAQASEVRSGCAAPRAHLIDAANALAMAD